MVYYVWQENITFRGVQRSPTVLFNQIKEDVQTKASTLRKIKDSRVNLLRTHLQIHHFVFGSIIGVDHTILYVRRTYI